MRATGAVLALSLGVPLLGCVSQHAPAETVILSRQKSAFDDKPDGRWRKAHPTRPVAVLLGRGATTKMVLPGLAALEASCHRRTPRVRVAFDVGLGSGGFRVAYRFDANVQRTGTTHVRGRSRNIVMIDYPSTAAAFLAELAASTTLKVKLTRLPYDFHEADFRWNPADQTLKDVLAACHPGAPRAGPRQPAPDDDDDDDPLDKVLKDVSAGD